VQLSDLQPGPKIATTTASNMYEENAFALSEGKRLYEWFNCVGCHSHGGGGMGPALKDEKRNYGSEPSNIFATIVEGRPNGMPSFRGKIPDYQVWQIVAYVRSLSGLVRFDIPSARDDDMNFKPSETKATPVRPNETPGITTPEKTR
jgi:cytochrome c oxidase cbb3-type subunit 3